LQAVPLAQVTAVTPKTSKSLLAVFIRVTLKGQIEREEGDMGKEESEKLQNALRELTRENDSKEKVTNLFMKDGYFDKDGKLAQEFRQSE